MSNTQKSFEKKPYFKSLDDELDWKLIDQLHGVVSQISSFCFETKKFCITTEFVVLTLLVRFTNDKLDFALVVAGFVIPICFWVLDSVAFYYQVKTRGRMKVIVEQIKERQKEQLEIPYGSQAIDSERINKKQAKMEIPYSSQIIEPERINKKQAKMVFDAMFNLSMLTYAFLIIVNIVVWAVFSDRFGR